MQDQLPGNIIIDTHFKPHHILGKYHKNWFFIAIRIIAVLIVLILLIYYIATNDHSLLFKNNATVFISLLIVLDIVLDHLTDKK